MKERYITPEMEAIVCEREDIVTASNETPFVPFNTNESDELSPIGYWF